MKKSSREEKHANKSNSSRNSIVDNKIRPVVLSSDKNAKYRSESVGRQIKKNSQSSIYQRSESSDRVPKTRQIITKNKSNDKFNSKYNDSNEKNGMSNVDRNNVRKSNSVQSKNLTKASVKSVTVKNSSQNRETRQSFRKNVGQSSMRSSPSNVKSSHSKSESSTSKTAKYESSSGYQAKKLSSKEQKSQKVTNSGTAASITNKMKFQVRDSTDFQVEVNNQEEDTKNQIRPRTSTIRKHETSANISESSSGFVEGSASTTSVVTVDGEKRSYGSEAGSYEDDFEEYESDFEDSDLSVEEENESSESGDTDNEFVSNKPNNQQASGIIIHPTIVKRQPVTPPKIIEKKTRTDFLRMSTRSSTFLIDDSNDALLDRKATETGSFINFASAIKKHQKQKLHSKVRKRGMDLLEIITLDEVSYDIINIPPVEYEVFIKAYGKSDHSQVAIQTLNYDHQEIQTEEISSVLKWTQHPPYDNFGVGSSTDSAKVDSTDDWQSLFKEYTKRLSNFIMTIEPVIFAILSEQQAQSYMWSNSIENKNIAFSQGFISLKSLPFCNGSSVIFVSYASSSSPYMLSVHSCTTQMLSVNVISEEKGIICIWNVSNSAIPECVLVSNAQPTCACFSPTGNSAVVAGMFDGSVVLWDLTEPSSVHLSYQYERSMLPLRFPTFNTAAAFDGGYHQGCIVSIQSMNYFRKTVYDDVENTQDKSHDKSFHLLSLDDNGTLNVWVVIEVSDPDQSGFDSELGLTPGGKMKLACSSTIEVYALPGLPTNLKLGMRAYDFQVFPGRPNNILVTTDVELIIHYDRGLSNELPKYYSRETDSSTAITCICFCPHVDNLFLAGGSDGCIMLFSVVQSRPLIVFSEAAESSPITCISWSPVHPCKFYVLNNASSMQFWDCQNSIFYPEFNQIFSESRVLWFSVYSYLSKKSKTSTDPSSHIALAKENGEIEVHAIHPSLDVITEQEYEKQMIFLKNI